jgi:hypothetical protein
MSRICFHCLVHASKKSGERRERLGEKHGEGILEKEEEM